MTRDLYGRTLCRWEEAHYALTVARERHRDMGTLSHEGALWAAQVVERAAWESFVDVATRAAADVCTSEEERA